jgi:hypothetical protein
MGSITASRHKHTRFWAVRSAEDELICVCVYKRGAMEVAGRLEAGLTYCLRDAPPPRREPPEAAREPE